ncbi:diaminopimelate decarboxylase [Carboxylicivirga sp. M1479]|uniref:diaminopimelate decarboxylase n=1 Tax=Carboxylicivirga sp. M1479 TaxID=2594476 RepID=UPI001177F0F7|nr:diaminopimelate decarboxylase [Carboxylicivirga sp. M1479]TRX72152.1 diaminopimelate decarboxylase [Carboxylicivirga sp. M1479]
MNFTFPIDALQQHQTPFYYYDMELLNATLNSINNEAGNYGFKVHYAVKANANDRILSTIKEAGFGADCVSGNEVKKALETGFDAQGVVFAGVGKADWEINLGLENDIACFNVESIPELEVINELAEKKGKIARVALRINPNVNANTHHYITTGLEENKFGINQWDLENVIKALATLKNVELEGLHFHIGSQITDLLSFKELCLRVNEIQKWFISQQILPKVINVGGGLGIDYEQPDEGSIPDFKSFFKIFDEFLELQPEQEVHFELGRSVVAQCGALLTRVLYVKNGVNTKFAIVDAGMSDLLRPALYQAYHKIENLVSAKETEKYDVVGPICESSDCFGKAIDLPQTGRGDLIAIRSTGAYGEIMANRYNLRELPLAYYSDEV